MSSGQPFTRGQIIKGVFLLGLYMVIKTIVSQVYELYQGLSVDLGWEALAVLGGMTVVCTVTLVVLGLGWWTGFPLQAWIMRKNQVVGDLFWGGGTVAVLIIINIMCYSVFVSFQLMPPAEEQNEAASSLSLLLGIGLGILVTAPAEEMLFRGFLQKTLQQSWGLPLAIGSQAAVYAVMYLGFFPVSMWFFILIPFLHGVVWGVVTQIRGTLLPALLAHAATG